MGILSIGAKLVKKVAVPVAKAVIKNTVPGAAIGFGAVSAVKSLGGGMGSKPPALPPLNLKGGAPQTAWAQPGGVPTSGGGYKARLEDLNTRDMQAMDARGERIPASQLLTYHKSPRKGFVVLKDKGGGLHCLRKDIARKYGWKPGHKPVISVGESQAIKKAARAVDKFHKIERESAKLMHFKQRVLGHHKSAPRGYEIVAKPSGEIVIPKKGA